MEESLRELGELRVVERIISRLRSSWGCDAIEPGDDATCTRIGDKGEYILLKIDGASFESVKLPWIEWRDVGWQQVIGVASDLIAKAARPLLFVVSIGISPEEEYSIVDNIIKGVHEAAVACGGWLGGGDTNSCEWREKKCGWIDIAAIGYSRRPLGRSPLVGDYVYTTIGRIGYGGVVMHSLNTSSWKDDIKQYKEIFREFSRPSPRISFVELVERVGLKCITGSIDVSDGLAFSLYLLGRASGGAIVVDNLPTRDTVYEYSRDKGVGVEELVFYGGQEYEIVFTVRPRCVEDVEDVARRIKLDVERVGRIDIGLKGTIFFRGRRIKVMRWDNFLGVSSLF